MTWINPCSMLLKYHINFSSRHYGVDRAVHHNSQSVGMVWWANVFFSTNQQQSSWQHTVHITPSKWRGWKSKPKVNKDIILEVSNREQRVCKVNQIFHALQTTCSFGMLLTVGCSTCISSTALHACTCEQHLYRAFISSVQRHLEEKRNQSRDVHDANSKQGELTHSFYA